MKAKITEKSPLRLSDLTREYKFDILTNDDEVVLPGETITARPSEVVNILQQKVAEYESVYEEENDVEVGQEV